jgi:hypothetical protein
VSIHAGITVNAQNSAVHIAPYYGSIKVNLSGVDTISAVPGTDSPGSGHFHLNAGALAIGTIASKTSIDGDPGSHWMNNGTSTLAGIANKIGVDVIGSGTIAITGKTRGHPLAPDALTFPRNLEFMHSVGSGQSVMNGGMVQIDDPAAFHGSVTMTSDTSAIDLIGLADADSYSYRNDMLTFWHGDTPIDVLRVHEQAQGLYGLLVQKFTPVAGAPGQIIAFNENTPGITDPLMPKHSFV